MQTYLRKPEIVKAAKYEKGMEDGIYEDIGLPYLCTPNGKMWILDGDYIVIDEKDRKHVQPPDIFEKKYSPYSG